MFKTHRPIIIFKNLYDKCEIIKKVVTNYDKLKSVAVYITIILVYDINMKILC